MNEIKHVYILGAGFSKPLGGPLFPELLSERYTVAIDEIIPPPNPVELSSRHLTFIRNPSRFIELIQDSMHRIFNAEEILEFCDFNESANFGFHTEQRTIIQCAQKAATLRGVGWPDVQISQINKWLRSRIAIETGIFLMQLPNDSERWRPYRQWFQKLNRDDTIITFNYDNVIEEVARETSRPYLFTDNLEACAEKLIGEGPRLLKLHGGINWFWDDKENICIIKPEKLSDLAERNVAIASPGLMKRSMSEGEFQHIWRAARIQLREATDISIIGYGMPETDILAMKLILEGIAENKLLQSLDIVLGPDSQSVRAQRMKEILDQVLNPRAPIRCSSSLSNLTHQFAQEYLLMHRKAHLDF